MITLSQIQQIAKQSHINENTIYREYLQLSLLSQLYRYPLSEQVYFKGGTAIHLIFGASRFSEDLDFTVNMEAVDFDRFIDKFFREFAKFEQVSFKPRKTIAGKKFLLTSGTTVLSYPTYISLDFSFREKVLDPSKSLIQTLYPVQFNSMIHHLSKQEILAEKIRAFLTRDKGRDMYDLWFLLSQNTPLNGSFIIEKNKYYQIGGNWKQLVLEKVEKSNQNKFITDLKPFITESERERLPQLFEYIKTHLLQILPQKM